MPDLVASLLSPRLPPRREPGSPVPTMPEPVLRAAMRGALGGRRGSEPFRLFAYGGLMWTPELMPGATSQPARIRGFARAWCLHDIHMRGTPEAPGLTLGLVPTPDALCDGVLFTLPEAGLEEALWPAWRQEMLPGFYTTAWVEAVPLPQGAPLRALTFVADASHDLWAGDLPQARKVEVLSAAVGPSGPGAEYLLRARDTLRAEGRPEPMLERLAEAIAARLAAGPAG
ncbi:MAG TPA: gamma-glutamylcyclotransferase [Acetobacteraceae bacterium]|nr:gamma-glutamylcyclotransferase [Acetobacteraceae bacterium]